MSHSIRTSFGDSKSTYGGDASDVLLNTPTKIIGQLNVAAPFIWVVVSIPLLNCLRKAGHGAAFKYSISGDTTKLVGYCFVDVSTIVQISSSPNTPTEDTVKLSQEGLNIFAGASRETGGQVSVHKTKLYLY